MLKKVYTHSPMFLTHRRDIAYDGAEMVSPTRCLSHTHNAKSTALHSLLLSFRDRYSLTFLAHPHGIVYVDEEAASRARACRTHATPNPPTWADTATHAAPRCLALESPRPSAARFPVNEKKLI